MLRVDSNTLIDITSAGSPTERAQAVLESLSGTVTITVYDSLGNIKGSGTMASLGTQSENTIDLGTVTSFDVTSTGNPSSATWTIVFSNDAGRYLIGSFGLFSDPDAEFRWSLTTWTSGQEGEIANATLVVPKVSVSSTLLYVYDVAQHPTPNTAPYWRSNFPTSINILEGGTYNFAVHATDAEGQTLTFSKISGQGTVASNGVYTAGATGGGLVISVTDGVLATNSTTCTVTVTGVVTTRVWNPGNYIATPLSKDDVADETRQNNAVISRVTTSPGNQYLVGGVFRLRWSRLETNINTFNWAVTDSIASRMQTAGKRFFFQLDTVLFGSGATAAKVAPAYMLNSTYDGGAARVDADNRSLVKLWNENCMTRKIAVQNAIINRYKTNPYFEGIVGCETALGSNVGTIGYTAPLAYIQYIRLFRELRALQPNHAMICYYNFYSGPGVTNDLQQGILDNMRTYDWICGGPDSRWEEGGTTGREYAMGVRGTTDYRGTVAMQACDQDSGLSSATYTTQKAIYGPWTFAKHMDWIKNRFYANYAFWTELPGADLYAPILSGLQSNPTASYRSTRPSGY